MGERATLRAEPQVAVMRCQYTKEEEKVDDDEENDMPPKFVKQEQQIKGKTAPRKRDAIRCFCAI